MRPSKLFILSLICLSLKAFAAPCCGGNQGQTALITGDQKGLLSMHTLYSQVVMDALNDGTYLKRDASSQEYQFSFLIDGAFLVSDRWQVGVRFPIVVRHVEFDPSPNQVGMGDVLVQGTFEALRELRYSPWKPRVFVFSQLSVPLGTSAFETNRPASSFSRGFFVGALGATAIKQWNVMDAALTTELHQGLPKSVDLSGIGNTKATPGVGTSVTASVGALLGKSVHVGLTESFVFDGGIGFDGATPDSSAQQFWSTSLQVSLNLSPLWTVRGVYTDQTLLGAARNVALSRFFGLTLTRSFLR